MAKVLLIDDEQSLRRVLSTILRVDHHEVVEAGTLAEGRQLIRTELFDLILTDQKLPDGQGTDLIAEMRDLDSSIPTVLITAYATVELAVSAMRYGAFDVMAKPFNPDAVRALVHRACERAQLMRSNERLQVRLDSTRQAGSGTLIIGDSRVIQDLRDSIERVAPSNATVLIGGETGTGKELVARSVHALSPRSKQPFIAVNCSGLSESLLEAELFGHEKGAFTGADRSRPGLFEAADSGTLFLDEAGEMSAALQAKLLRALEQGEVTRVGSTRSRHVDVRVIVATHRNLKERVKQGAFREDLYYRIAVFPITVPPLRKRLEDLPQLLRHFVVRACAELKLPPKTVSPEAVSLLSRYNFPGNVRELRNLIERACLLTGAESIEPCHFPALLESFPTVTPVPGAENPEIIVQALPQRYNLKNWLDAIESAAIKRALHEADGVQAEAARRLGLSRSDLAYKLKRFGDE